MISPSDPCSAWTAKANKRVQFGYGLNYLIDIENAVIVDVEPTPARTYDEVESTKIMLARTEQSSSRGLPASRSFAIDVFMVGGKALFREAEVNRMAGEIALNRQSRMRRKLDSRRCRSSTSTGDRVSPSRFTPRAARQSVQATESPVGDHWILKNNPMQSSRTYPILSDASVVLEDRTQINIGAGDAAASRSRGPITKNQVAALLKDFEIRPVVVHPTK